MLMEMTLSVLIVSYLLLWFYWSFVLGTLDGNWSFLRRIGPGGFREISWILPRTRENAKNPGMILRD
jgi:hypothetical protein